MPPSSGSEPQSPDGQAAPEATRVWSEWAAPPTPNTRRRMTEHHGTWAWYTAARARAPWRMVAACSAARPDHEAGLVDEVDDGQVERVGQLDERLHLLRGVGGHAAAVEHRVRGEDGDRPAVEAGQAGDRRRPQPAPISNHVPSSTTASMIGRTS